MSNVPTQDKGQAPSPNPEAQPTQKRTGGTAAAAAPGSGEPRKRLKLRSAMLNYISCLGMTTYKVSASKRFHRTHKKRLFFGV